MTQRKVNRNSGKGAVKKSGKKHQKGGKAKPAQKVQSAEDLDAALMKYMGVSAQKEALESQLDAYFSKPDDTSA